MHAGCVWKYYKISVLFCFLFFWIVEEVNKAQQQLLHSGGQKHNFPVCKKIFKWYHSIVMCKKL